MTHEERQDVLLELRELRSEFKEHLAENRHAHEAMAGDLQRHGEEKARMHRVLFGKNGSAPGLAERMRVQERFTENIRRLVWVIVPALVLSSLALLGNAIMFYISQRP